MNDKLTAFDVLSEEELKGLLEIASKINEESPVDMNINAGTITIAATEETKI